LETKRILAIRIEGAREILLYRLSENSHQLSYAQTIDLAAEPLDARFSSLLDNDSLWIVGKDPLGLQVFCPNNEGSYESKEIKSIGAVKQRLSSYKVDEQVLSQMNEELAFSKIISKHQSEKKQKVEN